MWHTRHSETAGCYTARWQGQCVSHQETRCVITRHSDTAGCYTARWQGQCVSHQETRCVITKHNGTAGCYTIRCVPHSTVGSGHLCGYECNHSFTTFIPAALAPFPQHQIICLSTENRHHPITKQCIYSSGQCALCVTITYRSGEQAKSRHGNSLSNLNSKTMKQLKQT